MTKIDEAAKVDAMEKLLADIDFIVYSAASDEDRLKAIKMLLTDWYLG